MICQKGRVCCTINAVDKSLHINGDLTQTDLPHGVKSGLLDAIHTLKNVPEIAFVTFTEKDVVRHGLVSKIVKAYEQAYQAGKEK